LRLTMPADPQPSDVEFASSIAWVFGLGYWIWTLQGVARRPSAWYANYEDDRPVTPRTFQRDVRGASQSPSADAYCIRCGGGIGSDWAFCNRCGSQVPDTIPATTASPTATEPCHLCATPVGADEVACSSCGAAPCANCDAWSLRDAMFCPGCGEKFAEARLLRWPIRPSSAAASRGADAPAADDPSTDSKSEATGS
jgi:hypothetical protein